MTVGKYVKNLKYAFEWALTLGVIVIFVTKWVAQEQPIWGGVIASGIGILIMVLYVERQKRERPEFEYIQVGQESYYLGLLYTLTSLCATLIFLFLVNDYGNGSQQSLEDRICEMIGSLGIALLTTLAGIIIRILLQRRATKNEQITDIRIPQSGAIDLESYAYELRKQLQASANAFNSHANLTILQAKTTHAHLDEMMKQFRNGLTEKANADLELLDTVYKAISEKVEEISQQGGAQQADIRSAMEQFEVQLKSMNESLKRVREVSDETADNLGSLGTQAKEISRILAESEK